MAASPQVVTNNPKYLNARTGVYTGKNLRQPWDDVLAIGVQDYDSFRVRQNAGAPAMNVDCMTTSVLNRAFVRGSSVSDQGVYRIDYNSATVLNLDVAANVSGNPRIDSVYLVIEDSEATGVNDRATVVMVTGTATVGATLDNRTGAGAQPASSILLADILVASGAVSIANAVIRDRRPFANIGTIPPLGSTGTQIDAVSFEPHYAMAPVSTSVGGTVSINAGNDDNLQTAVLMWLPRRIVATRARWRYEQGATANAGNYVLFFADASGRVIGATAATAFTGAANQPVTANVALTATVTFEAGWYWVGIGIGAITALAQVAWPGIALRVSNAGASGMAGPPAPNLALRAAAGGSAAPTTVLGFSDMITFVTAATNVQAPPVPVPVLSAS